MSATDRATERTVIVVGPFTYTRRPYTPKRRGQRAGWGWLREWNGQRAEVGMEAEQLVDEIDRLRSAPAATSSPFSQADLDLLRLALQESPWDGERIAHVERVDAILADLSADLAALAAKCEAAARAVLGEVP